jgi:nucleoside-triphosphatase THEP1
MAKRHFKPLEEGEENILTNIEDDMYNDGVDFARKQEEVRAKAINILKNIGYSGFIANRQNSCTLKFPVNGLQDRNQIYNALYNGLGVTSEYDLTVKIDSNLNGTVFYCKVNLPTWNKLNGNSINESILEKVITESIKEILSEDHLKVVDNIPEMESYIHDTWNSPNDVWWVKIEARKKDYKNYNIRNKGQKPTKWWKRVGGPDSTDRENHVGYVIVRGANAEAAVNSMKNAVVHLNPWAADIAGTDKVYSNGNCEAIKTVCHQFFARAYITVNPRKMDATVQKARDDKKSGLFKGREFHHRVGQARTGVDSSGFNWSIDRPNGLVDCDVDDAQGQKWLEDYFSQQGVEIKLRKPSHDGMHYIISIDDAKKCDFKYILKNMSQYDTNNRKGDPSVLFKPDANIILYSAVG